MHRFRVMTPPFFPCLYLLVLLAILTSGVEVHGAALGDRERAYLSRLEKATFNGFGLLIDEPTQFPVDIGGIASGQAVKNYHDTNKVKTSPTNIGLGFIYLVLARDRNIIPETLAVQKAVRMMGALEKLEKRDGFLYNWYLLSGKEGETPKVSLNRFVSSLDNGDLDVCLLIARAALPDAELRKRIDAYLDAHSYAFFYSKNPHFRDSGMISIGYDDALKAYSGADYNILNTEARMTVLLAIVKDRVPESAWLEQSRVVKSYRLKNGKTVRVVAPWGGSLYETLFAGELIGDARIAPKAFLQNALNMISIHEDKGSRCCGGVWGFSNGEVPGENRYEMTGVPEIAYNRFPGEFVTPYSVFLAFQYRTASALSNLEKIEALNSQSFNPNYGFTDSIDPKTGKINAYILSLDKGIEMLSLGNFLNKIEGKKDAADYFWDSLEAKGWAGQAKALIKTEEKTPAFLAVNGARTSGSRGSAAKGAGLFKEDQIGSFAETNRATATLTMDPARSEMQLYYDVSQRYSYSGLFANCSELTVSPYQALTFNVRGDRQEGFPETVKVELKYRGRTIQFEHFPVSAERNEINVPIYEETPVDQVSFVIESAAALQHPRGKIFIDSLKVR